MRPTRTLAAGCALTLAAAPLTTTTASAQEVQPARVAGADRYATAAEVARLLYPDGVSEAVVGSGLDFPDALAGAPLASANSSPVLLTDADGLPQVTLDALSDLGVDQVTLLGGESAVSADVAQDLEDRGHVVGRVAGDDRWETAAELARAVYAENSGANYPGGRRAVFVANGHRFPDALAASAPASAGPAQIPIVLTEDDSLPGATSHVLQELDVDLAVLVGGTTAIDESVRRAIEDLGVDTERVGGQTRTDTATSVASFAQEHLGFDATSYLLARGDAFPDALAAGPLGGMRGDAILLTRDPDTLSSSTRDHLASMCPDVEVVRAVGGEQAVTPQTLQDAEGAAESCGSDGGAQASVAAVDVDGRAVLLDPGTGAVRRVLLDGIAVDDPADNGIAVTPDRSTVFVVRPGQSGVNDDIVHISAAGGEPHLTFAGQAPAVSPDGSTLAYVHNVASGGPGQPSPTLRLRDLSSGAERQLSGGDFYAIDDLTWLPDSNRIVFTAGEIRHGVHVVSRAADSLAEARRLGPGDLDASWSDVATLGDDTSAVVERCCSLTDPETWRVVSVDVRTGEVGSEVFGRERTEASFIDDRQDGQGMVVVRQVRPAPDGGTLLRWDGGDGLAQVRDGVVAAAW